MKHAPITSSTLQQIALLFSELDYRTLEAVYCDEGGEAFWNDRRKPCQQMGTNVAKALKNSTYVLADTGHFMALQTPQLFVDTLLPFFKGA